MAIPTNDEIIRLLHDLRDPLGSFAIRLSLLDETPMSDDARRHLAEMHKSFKRMTHALATITTAFALDTESIPLAIGKNRRPDELER
ncbi:MAG TPA: hypothetical protein VGP93_14440 [Polyangiaceae bacterium]|nr:hypothetical protein [Polyangiaceae bacterium]